MNRNALLAEKRTRLLLAIRQTYNDFFHDYFISSDQVFTLRVGHASCTTCQLTACVIQNWARGIYEVHFHGEAALSASLALVSAVLPDVLLVINTLKCFWQWFAMALGTR